MIDAVSSHQSKQEEGEGIVGNRHLWILVALVVMFTGLGFLGFALLHSSGSDGAASVQPQEQVSSELLETTKDLQRTQQQAFDQLQVVQDQLTAQKEETKKLSEQIAALTGKLLVLQQSAAEIPPPPAPSNSVGVRKGAAAK
jgi:septal ring factor EnvC (AmiA/AmiB activator)